MPHTRTRKIPGGEGANRKFWFAGGMLVLLRGRVVLAYPGRRPEEGWIETDRA